MFIYPIQTLRGFSILLIVFYHYYPKLFSGGYLGVTLFLEISGFVNNKLDEEFSAAHFYIKRINSIYPSLLIVVLFIKIMIKNLSYNELLSYYRECKYTLKGYVNYYFYKKSIDYFNQFDNPSFILNFWYISVQTQIYAIFPLIKLFNCFNTIIILISYSVCAYYSKYNKSRSYYLLECRIYEFVIGYSINKSEYYFKFRNKKSVIYILVYIILVLAIYGNANTSFYITSVTSIAGFLVLKILVNISDYHKYIILDYFGKYSFQLYLIHYPLMYLIESNIYTKLIYVFSLSVALYSLVNSIIYKKDNLKIMILVLFCITLFYRYLKYTEDSIIKKKSSLMYIPKEDPLKEYYRIFGMFKLTAISKIPNNNVIFLLCDSHGQQWFPSIINITKSYGMNLVHIYFHADIIEKQKYNDLISIIKCHIENCNNYIISSFYISKRWINNFNIFNMSFIKYGKLLSSFVQYVIFIQDIPILYSDPMKCIYSEKLKDTCLSVIGINASFNSLPIISLKSIYYCNMNNYICPNNICNYLHNNKYIKYKDFNHLTLSYSYLLTNHFKNECLSFFNITNNLKRIAIKIKLF